MRSRRGRDTARARAARPLPRRLAAGRRGLRPPVHRLRGRERHRRLPAARPAQRHVEPPRGGRGDRAGGREFEAGLVYSPGRTGETEPLIEQARGAAGARRRPRAPARPDGLAAAASRARARDGALREASGLPVGIYCQGAGGNALAAALEAARAGADLIACAIYPLALTLHRVSGEALAEALAGLGLDSRRRRLERSGAPRTSSTSTSATSRSRRSRRGSPSAPRSTVCPRRSSPRSTPSPRPVGRRPPRRGARRSSAGSGRRSGGRRWRHRSARCSARRRSSTSCRRAATRSSWTSCAPWSRAGSARRRLPIDPTIVARWSL